MTRHFCRTFVFASLAMIALALPARAVTIDTINFDDISDQGIGTPIPNGYNGFNWSNFEVLNSQLVGDSPNGYVHGTVSQPNVAFNGFGNPASFSSATPLSLFGGYFTGAWNDGLSVTIDGFLGGVLKDTTTFTVNTESPTLEAFNWIGIDEVTLSTIGGTDQGFGGHGTQVAIDNLQVSQDSISAVSLPRALPMFGAALLALGAFAWRRREQANTHLR